MKKDQLQPRWSDIERKPTWSHISTHELAKLLTVSIQDINNWVLRESFPQPEGKKRNYGNRNWFRISKIKSWLENKPEQEIHDEWIVKHINGVQHMRTFEEIQEFVKKSWRILDLEKPI